MSSLDENPNCARTHATFRLVGDALDPHEITGALGIPPTRALRKDQEIPDGGKGKTTRRQSLGVWLLATEHTLDSTSLERHLITLLDAIEPTASQLGAVRARRGLRADFFCYWLSATGHGGPEVSPGTLPRIAALDAPLGIDFYGP
jgi:hypothetical protein